MKAVTWRDVEALALTNPTVHTCVALVKRGDWTREEALIAATLTLAEQVQRQHEALVERMSLCTCRVVYVPAP